MSDSKGSTAYGAIRSAPAGSAMQRFSMEQLREVERNIQHERQRSRHSSRSPSPLPGFKIPSECKRRTSGQRYLSHRLGEITAAE